MPSLLAILGLDRSGFSSGLDQAKGEAHTKGMDIGAALGGKVVAGLTAAAIGAAAKKEFDAVKELAAQAKEIQFGASRLDVGAQRFQDLQYAAEKGRTSIEAVYGAYRKLAVNTEEALGGNREMVAHFAALGVSVADLRNKSPDELFQQIAGGMDGASMSGSKLAATIKTLGKSADELLPAMRAGLFGGHNPLALSKDDLTILQAFGRETKESGHAWTRLWNSVHVDVARSLLELKHWTSEGLGKALQPAKELKGTGLGDAARMEAAAAAEAADVKRELLKEEQHQRERLVQLIEKQMGLNKQFIEGGLNDTEKLAMLEGRRNELLRQTFNLTTAQGQADAQELTNKVTESNIEIQKMLKGEEASLRRTKPDTSGHLAGAYNGPADRNYTLIKLIEQHVKTIAGKTHSERRQTIGGF